MNMAAILPLVRDGKLRGLAVTSLKRSPTISDPPTLAESGFPDFEAISWFGLLALAGTPAAVVSKVHADIVQIAVQADVRERIAQPGSRRPQFAGGVRRRHQVGYRQVGEGDPRGQHQAAVIAGSQPSSPKIERGGGR